MKKSGSKDLTASKLTDEQIATLVKNGKNAMPPYKGLYSDDEIRAVIAYVKTLRK